MQSSNSKNLQHASFEIQGGKGLFSPIHRALKNPVKPIHITAALRSVLLDWRTLVQHLGKNPTPVQLLVTKYPNYLQYTDACKLITSGLGAIQFWVWQYEWPLDIQRELVSATNKGGKLTINNLELAGLVLGWLVLEHVVADFTFKHVGMFCDNTSAVAWAYKGSTSTSIAAARLLRLLSIRQRVRQASSLLPMNIARKDNAMADIPSRAFKNGEFFHAKENIVSFVNSTFPLPKELSWKEFKVPDKLA